MRAQQLFEDDSSKPFKGQKAKDSDKDNTGGYLNHGALVCNGKQAMWLSRRYMHLFNVEDGIRIKKERVWKSDGKPHICSFD